MKSMQMALRHTFLVLAFFAVRETAAQSAKVADISNRDVPAVWLGLDFTEARLIGDIGANENDIKDRIVNDINQLIVNEAKKYDIDGALKKSGVKAELGFTYEMNKKMDEKKLKSSNESDYTRLNKEMIEKMVAKYDFKDQKGLGVLFIVEAMNKSKDKAAIWVTWIDMSSKKVLQTERKEGKAGGFGFRNFWARSAYEVMNDLKKGK
jgi:hypothetical protein